MMPKGQMRVGQEGLLPSLFLFIEVQLIYNAPGVQQSD